MLCDQECCEGNKNRIMPDVHAGKVGPIGFTMTVKGKVMPAIVSGDIGCGVTLTEIANLKKGLSQEEYKKLDGVIRDRVPSGTNNRQKAHLKSEEIDLSELRCASHVQLDRAYLGLGTLGGGNHFIEIDQKDKNFYLIIHSGSRNLGQQVCDYYMKAGQKVLKEAGKDVPYEMTWLGGELAQDYLADVQVVCKYAQLNRRIMQEEIFKGMKWKPGDSFFSVHNYIGEDGILRKGAVSAKAGERVIIPANMAEGCFIGIGKGNPDWNESAPHGTGRIIMRTEVKNSHTVSEFKKVMKAAGVYSSCIGAETLDEAPFAYRNMDAISAMIGDTIELNDILKSCYNYKAGAE